MSDNMDMQKKSLRETLRKIDDSPLPVLGSGFHEAEQIPPAAVKQFAPKLEKAIEREAAKIAPAKDTPGAGRAASAAIAVTIDQVVADVRAKVAEMHKAAEDAEKEAEAFIEEITRRGLALQDRIEGFARFAKQVQARIKEVGDEQT